MVGYTIKSTSNEGIYYLSKNWRKNNVLWVKREHMRQEYLFTSLGRAKASLNKLLEVMPEYKDDVLVGYYINGETEKEI